MTPYETQKLKEVVLYILNKTKGLDDYIVFKVLYFAEREHLCKYGSRIVADEFCALPYGPVPTHLYNAIKDKTISALFTDIIAFTGDDASNVLLAQRACDLDYLSNSNVACIDNAIQDNIGLSFSELKEKSHDLAWQRASYCKTISLTDMARAGGASEEMIKYIREQKELESLLA